MKKLPTLRGRTVVNLFYESSTRTLASFELAAKRLSADTMSLRAGRLLRGQGRVAEGHGAHALGVRPRRDRRPPPVDRRRRARRALHERARRERGRREAPASDPGPARPATRWRRRSGGSRGCTSRSSATSSTRASLARSCRRSELVGARSTLVGPPTLLPRGIEALGCEVSTTSARPPTRTSSTSSACSRSGWRPARRSCPRCASTRRSTGSRRSGCARGRSSCTPGR